MREAKWWNPIKPSGLRSATRPERKGVHRRLAQGKTDKSFLVLFFKKEQKKTSFLKKRSKKLLSFWPRARWRAGVQT
jgi:hypothetical protein